MSSSARLGQDVRQAAVRADAGEGLAERAGGAGDQDRPGGSPLGRQRVVARPRDGCGRAAATSPGRSSTGWSNFSPAAELRRRPWRQRRARRLGARVERAGVVDAVAPGQQRAPVDSAEQRPEGDRADVGALARAAGSAAFQTSCEPAQLLVAGAAVVDLGDRDRHAVALPASRRRGREPERRRQSVARAPPRRRHRRAGRSPPGSAAGIAVDAVVEEPLAGQIMVDADDVGRAVAARQARRAPPADAAVAQPAVQRVAGDRPGRTAGRGSASAARFSCAAW